MFEKEAEEIANKRCHEIMCYGHCSFSSPKHHRCGEWHREYECAKEGAEFGYNKANEWHYPSKGELPKCDEKTQLIFYVNCYYEVGGETLTRKRMVLGFYKKSFINDDVKLFVEKSKGYEEEHLPKDVIAWKEIVLPELKESE